MDTHGAVTEVAHTTQGHAIPETGERFEKSELDSFLADDKIAGQNIGKLLALVFLISFFLMSGVCVWMITNSSVGHDPQAGIGLDSGSDSDHH